VVGRFGGDHGPCKRLCPTRWVLGFFSPPRKLGRGPPRSPSQLTPVVVRTHLRPHSPTRPSKPGEGQWEMETQPAKTTRPAMAFSHEDAVRPCERGGDKCNERGDCDRISFEFRTPNGGYVGHVSSEDKRQT
jgi:hypothetical protein